jgi:hypothetical protein
LEYTWYDNDAPAGTGRNISVKLSPGAHTIKLEVSDGTQTSSAPSISVQVEKKTTVAPVTSGGGMGWLPIAAILAIVLVVVAVAVLAMRRKQSQEPEPSGMGRVDEVPGGVGVALAPVPPAETGAGGEEGAAADEARRKIAATMDRLADYQEAHPDEVVDMSPVMEKIDIAREMLGTGAGDDALDFAKEAGAEADKIMAPKAPAPPAPRKVVKKRAA